jgi:hypothetical protein
MNRVAVARELVKLARELVSASPRLVGIVSRHRKVVLEQTAHRCKCGAA